MSGCYLIFDEDGELVCTVNHRDYQNCDLTPKDKPHE